MKKFDANDYTFWGLYSNGVQVHTPLDTLAYLVGLVDTSQNAVADLRQAKFILRYLFDVEEQVRSGSELLSVQEQSLPKGFCPQTPVMLTIRWSPISAILKRAWKPVVLARESGRMACASGIWEPKALGHVRTSPKCETPEELFWHVLHEVTEKGRLRGLLLSIIAKPGWSYDSNVDRPCNLTITEAKTADRVIWQRTPRAKARFQ